MRLLSSAVSVAVSRERDISLREMTIDKSDGSKELALTRWWVCIFSGGCSGRERTPKTVLIVIRHSLRALDTGMTCSSEGIS